MHFVKTDFNNFKFAFIRNEKCVLAEISCINADICTFEILSIFVTKYVLRNRNIKYEI